MNTEEGTQRAGGETREPSKKPAPPDPIYTATVNELRSEAMTLADWMPLLLLVIVMAMPAGDRGGVSVLGILVTVGAFFVHDLSAWGALHILGISDTSRLLFPFFRRARPQGGRPGEAWKRGLVIILSALPGLVMALVFAVVSRAVAAPDLGDVALRLAVIHAFWLLPLGFLDGGQLMNIVIFSRSRVAEYLFLAVTSVALIALAIWLEIYVIAVFAAFPLLGLARQHKVQRAAAEFDQRFPGPQSRVEDLDEDRMRGLFDIARDLSPASGNQMNPAGYAKLMREVHAKVALPPPSALWSLLLLTLYGACFVIAATGMILAVTKA